jgi:putative salt-induced outer membrane protein
MNTVIKVIAVSVIALMTAALVVAQQRALGIETLND